MGSKGKNKKKSKQIKKNTNSAEGTSNVMNTVATALDNKTSSSKKPRK